MENQETKWRMNLQLFAEGANEEDAQAEANPQTSAEAGAGQDADRKAGANLSEQTYTADEVLKLIQSEADKRVAQALAKQKRDYDKRMSMSNLGEHERAIAEKDDEIAGLKEQIAELAQFKTRHAVMTELTARGLDPTLADVIALTDDEAEMKTRLDAFERAWRETQQRSVKAQLSGNAPAKGSASVMTRDAFRKMPLAKQQEMYKNDPETYKKMTEG